MERVGQDIQDMLTAWMMTYQTKQWSEGLKYVASKKNRAIYQVEVHTLSWLSFEWW